MSTEKQEVNPELDWLNFRNEYGESTDSLYRTESFTEKFTRKVKENPFVPIGALATLGCLTFGLYSFRRGEKRMSQMAMRGRLFAQGFTIAALVIGLGMSATQKTIAEK